MNPRKTLLDGPVDEVALLVAQDEFDQWVKAHTRLAQANDPDALHHFRVALRRLRSTLRAFRLQLRPLVPPRTRRRLRRLAAVTGTSRNLQVERAWVLGQLDSLSPDARTGARWLLASLEVRQRAADEQRARRVAKDFPRVERRLRRAFQAPDLSAAGGHRRESVSAGVVVRQALGQWTRELDHRLHTIRTLADWDDAHAARIAAKRIRYLMEPFKGELPGGGATVEQLTALQDVLGVLQDARVLTGDLRSAFGEVAAEQARRACDALLPWSAGAALTTEATVSPADEAGLVALARRLGAECEAAFEHLRQEWLEQRASALLPQLHQLSGSRSRKRVSRTRSPGRRRRRGGAQPGLTR